MAWLGGLVTNQQEVCGTWVPVKQQRVIRASDCDGCARELLRNAVRVQKNGEKKRTGITKKKL